MRGIIQCCASTADADAGARVRCVANGDEISLSERAGKIPELEHSAYVEQCRHHVFDIFLFHQNVGE